MPKVLSFQERTGALLGTIAKRVNHYSSGAASSPGKTSTKLIEEAAKRVRDERGVFVQGHAGMTMGKTDNHYSGGHAGMTGKTSTKLVEEATKNQGGDTSRFKHDNASVAMGETAKSKTSSQFGDGGHAGMPTGRTRAKPWD